jgi:hypothetical protein
MTDNLDAIYKTIGRFVVTFSKLEQELGETLTALFKLPGHPDRGVIIGAINFAGKVNILKQAAQNATLPDKTPATDEWKKNIVGTLNSVFDLNNKQRNVLMHSYLEPRDDGGLVLEAPSPIFR